jgi:hypothetical protein
MTHVLSYADGTATSRLRHEGGPHGGRVVVPPARSRAPLWVMLAGGASLAVFGCGATLVPQASAVGAASAVAGMLLLVAGGVQLALPGTEPAAVFYYHGPPGAVTELGAEVYLSGDPVPRRPRWRRAEIDDVRYGFARGFDAGQPTMELVVVAAGREPVGLVPPRRDPATLHVLATILRGVLGLPPAREVRAAWLRGQAARRQRAFEPVTRAPDISGDGGPPPPPAAGAGDATLPGDGTSAPPPPPPPTDASACEALPVLGYREPVGVEVGSMLDRADVTPQRLTLTLGRHDGFNPRPVWLRITPDRLDIGAHGSPPHAWPCDEVYGVFVDFAHHDAPAELCVCTAGGNARLLTGARTRTLHELANLLNSALGVAGSAY